MWITFPLALHHNVGLNIGITIVLVGVLGGVFLKGFTEAFGIAALIVIIYLALNLIVIVRALAEAGIHPGVVPNWTDALRLEFRTPLVMIGVSLLVFPRLALGLSGFETGVAVMPVVKGEPSDTEQIPAGRIRNMQKLMTTAALVMSL